MLSKQRQSPGKYFHRVLESGAKYFRYRSGVYSLLGAPRRGTGNVSYPPIIPPMGFKYTQYPFSINGLDAPMEKPLAFELNTGSFTFYQQQNATPVREGESKSAAETIGIKKTQEAETGDKDTAEIPLPGSLMTKTNLEKTGTPRPLFLSKAVAREENPGLEKVDKPIPGVQEAGTSQQSTTPNAAHSKVMEIRVPGREPVNKRKQEIEKNRTVIHDNEFSPGDDEIKKASVTSVTPVAKINFMAVDKQTSGIQLPGKIEKAPGSPKPGETHAAKQIEPGISPKESMLIEKFTTHKISDKQVSEILLPGRTEKKNPGKFPGMTTGGAESIMTGFSLTGQREKPGEKEHEPEAAKKGTKVGVKRTVEESETGLIPAGKAPGTSPKNEKGVRESVLLIEQLRQEVHRLKAKMSSPSPRVKEEEQKQRENQSQRESPEAKPLQPEIIVKPLPWRSHSRQIPPDFWECSYLGRFHLKNL